LKPKNLSCGVISWFAFVGDLLMRGNIQHLQENSSMKLMKKRFSPIDMIFSNCGSIGIYGSGQQVHHQKSISNFAQSVRGSSILIM
ncbi:hypothetical protein R1flu_017198, partial [Riccia fluitans]